MKIKLICGFCVVFVAFLSTSVQAADDRHAWTTMTLFGGGHILGGENDTSHGAQYGVKLGYEIKGKSFRDRLGIEGSFAKSGAKTRDAGDNTRIARLDMLYFFDQPKAKALKKMTPFISIGLGAMLSDKIVDTDPGDGINFLLAYGGGLKYALTDYLALRGDVRHLLVFEDDQRNDFEYTIGLSYTFGKPRKAKKSKKAEPLDRDADGVIDSLDGCPETPAGIRVDKNGCPVDTTDSDADGIADYLDQCPGTAAGIRVDAQGCFFDDDGDGVPNELDKCPHNPPGFKVDEKGCTDLGS